MKLPQSAFNHRAWWSNNPTNSVMTKAWLAAGFRSEEVDMTARKLVFSRKLPDHGTTGPNRVAPASTGSPLAGLFGGLKGTVHVEPGTDLTLPSTAPVYLYAGGEGETPLLDKQRFEDMWHSSDTTESGVPSEEYSPLGAHDWPEEN